MGATPRGLVGVWAVLLGLLALTYAGARIALGPFNPALSYGVAAAKALLILLYFMELRHRRRMTLVAAGLGFFWLGILLVLGLSDYLSRGWLPWSAPLGNGP